MGNAMAMLRHATRMSNTLVLQEGLIVAIETRMGA